jgi:glycosyltransferase involved in cell wall biosynthesis
MVEVTESARGILILDMSYTLRMFRERQLLQALESRAVDGYFTAVISVHPLAGLFERGHERYGGPTVTWLDERHVFVEGKVGASKALAWLPPLNFVVGQIELVRVLVRMSRTAGIAVVRIGDPYYLGVLGFILARLLKVPLATRVPFRFDEIRKATGRATMPRLLRYGWIEKLLERLIFPRCDLIAGANEDNMRYAIENGGRAEVATVFRYGNLLHPSHWTDPAARPDAHRELEELGLAGKRFVATVARFDPIKRIDDVLRVVAQLTKDGCDVHALIVGDGAARESLAVVARSLGVEERVVWAGTRDQDWLSRVLPHAAVIVSPHMGRALAEAALSAVPMVAYDYDWQREVVVDGDTGYLVANLDWPMMADRTKRLLDDPARARAMGLRARAKVYSMMEPGTLIRHEQETYSRLLAAWSARQRGGHVTAGLWSR